MEVCENGMLFPLRDHGTEQEARCEEDNAECSSQQKTPCLKSCFMPLNDGGHSISVKDV